LKSLTNKKTYSYSHAFLRALPTKNLLRLRRLQRRCVWFPRGGFKDKWHSGCIRILKGNLTNTL